MKQWKEPVKTALLTVLIVISFLLTAILWSNRPQFQPFEPVQYVKSKPVQTRQLKELVTPEAVMYHYGEDRHTKAYANDARYRYIAAEMGKWYFFDFVSYPLTEEKWNALTRKSTGLEIQFRSNVPIKVVSQLFNFQDEGYQQINGIDRLWLYYSEEEGTVFALFINSQEEKILRARTAVSVKDLRESYLPMGKMLPEQILKVTRLKGDSSYGPDKPFWYIYYLPKNTVKMGRFLYNFLPITDDELIDAYFLDRTLVRQIVERDGTIIYTDGSRSIQMPPGQQMITFTDPAFQQGNRNMTKEDKVKGAINFINSHLGWTDDYHFESIVEHEHEEDIIKFRQYLGAYPLISPGESQLDSIAIMSEAGQVVTMKRSLIDLDKYIDHKEWLVMSGPELYQYIRDQKLLDLKNVKNAYLAYQAKVHQGYVELLPTWVIESVDGQVAFINAKSRQGGGKPNGLEQSQVNSNLGLSHP